MTRKQFFQFVVAVLTGAYFTTKTQDKFMSRAEFEDNWYGYENYQEYLDTFKCKSFITTNPETQRQWVKTNYVGLTIDKCWIDELTEL